MGTRADFYIGRDEKASWLGSIAWDGDPESMPVGIRKAETVESFQEAVSVFITSREDGTGPQMGWPWPWDDSRLTDYTYCFDGGVVWCSYFGTRWFKAASEQSKKKQPPATLWPAPPQSAAAQGGFTVGPRSGVMVVGGK